MLNLVWPCSAYPIFGLFGFFFQPEQYFPFTPIQSEQCFSVSFSQVLDQRTVFFSQFQRSFSQSFFMFSGMCHTTKIVLMCHFQPPRLCFNRYEQLGYSGYSSWPHQNNPVCRISYALFPMCIERVLFHG